MYKQILEKFDYSKADITRIDACIDMMKEVYPEKFDMLCYQNLGTARVAESLEVFNECGTSACFMGYFALNPVFQKAGGTVGRAGNPKFAGCVGGEVFDLFIGAKNTGHDSLGVYLKYCSSGLYKGIKFVKLEHVVERLEYIKLLAKKAQLA